jgi:hypothetical protein
MGTFAIDLLTGNQYLFNGNFTNSGMTTFSGITSVNNGLSMVTSRQAKLGGVLNCSTILTRGAGNTAGVEYGGNYSASFSNRSLVDKGYVDNKVSGSTVWGNITGTLSGQTDLQLELNLKLDTAIPITYNALIALMNASGLTKAQFYIITDFQTIHNIFDGTTVLPTLHYGGIIPINVQALSTTELSNTITSTLFPQDLLYYDVRDNLCEDGTTPRKGKITYRKNMISNIEAHYDYKHVVFRRWKFQLSGYTAWASGGVYIAGDEIVYNHYLYVCIKPISGSTDTPDILPSNFVPLINDIDYLSWQSGSLTIGGNPDGICNNTYPVNALDFQDFYTFTDASGNERSQWFQNITIGEINYSTTNLYYNSIVFQAINNGGNHNVKFGYDNYFMSFGNSSYDITFGSTNSKIISLLGNNTNIKFGNDNSAMLLGNGNSYITANNWNNSITFGNNNNAVFLGSSNANTIFGNSNSALFFQDSNGDLIFGNNNINVIFNSVNTYLTFGENNYAITFSSNNSSITFGDNNYNLIFYSSNGNIVFGNTNHNILIVTNNDSITFGDNNEKIELHNANINMVFGDNNNGNTFTNNISNFNFSGITLLSNYFFNDLDGGSIIFTSGNTFLTQNFTCEVFKRIDGTIMLQYYDNANAVNVVKINTITGSTKSQYASIQLVDHSGSTDVNTVIPTPIIWTAQEYSGDDIIFTGGSRIRVTETGNYKISYTVNVVNQSSGIKTIGSLIRKNDDEYITPLTSASYGVNTINDTGTNVMPLYAVSLNINDYLELVAFRVGSNPGSVLTVPSGSWFRMEKTN